MDERYKVAMDAYRSAKKIAEEADKHVWETRINAENVAKDIIIEGLGSEAPQKKYIAIGDWECESKSNPIGICVYNHKEDSCHDSCLYCGEPDERK